MTVLPPPGWTIAAAVLAAVLGTLAALVISKTPQGYDRQYAYFFASLSASVGGAQLGMLVVYGNLYAPGHDYTWANRTWPAMYMVGMWTLICMALSVTVSRQDKFPATYPRLEFALQGFACLYLLALTCNQLAALAPKASQQDVLGFGKFVFAMTTLVALMTGVCYLSRWTEGRFIAARAKADSKKSTKVDMTKQLDEKEL